jgi:hypothetical protein
MLAALGLGRLEKELVHGSVTTVDVAEFLERAAAVDVHTLAREGMPEALEHLQRRQLERVSDTALAARRAMPRHAMPLFATDLAEMTLPTRIHSHSQINPQFRATQHVNRV